MTDALLEQDQDDDDGQEPAHPGGLCFTRGQAGVFGPVGDATTRSAEAWVARLLGVQPEIASDRVGLSDRRAALVRHLEQPPGRPADLLRAEHADLTPPGVRFTARPGHSGS